MASNESTSRSSRMDQLKQAVEERPDDPMARVRLGMALLKAQSVKKAEEQLRKAVELDPDCVEGWVNLGGALLGRWDFKGSVEANQRARACDPKLFEAHYNEGLGHLYLGNAEDMLACFERALEVKPDHPATVYHHAVALLAVKRIDEARAELTRAAQLGYSPQPDFIRALERQERKS